MIVTRTALPRGKVIGIRAIGASRINRYHPYSTKTDDGDFNVSTPPSPSMSVGELKSEVEKKRIYFYALPLTTKKTFLHCKYRNEIFPGGKETLENKLIGKFVNVWKKFSESDNKINTTIVGFIDKVLSRIPWLETCLLSIPSQKFITRKLRADSEAGTKFVTHTEILEKNLSSKDLEDFDFYYPKGLTDVETMLETFRPEFRAQYEMHRKGIFTDLMLLPLTIPVALVPLVPNVPGFYLLYRVYCHIKVIASLKFLVTLLKELHFKFHKVDGMREIYLKTADQEIQANVLEQMAYVGNKMEFTEAETAREEKLLISEDVVEELCRVLDDEQCAEKLRFAIRQELQNMRKHDEELDSRDN
jgi:hypothetical protein